MIYITGDTHGDLRSLRERLAAGPQILTESDYLIVCGDFGFVFYDELSDAAGLRLLSEIKPQILFIDGNHENFDRLSQYPVEIWNGGKTHRINSHVRHLMRGQVFTIENRTFFVMGGGYSLNIKKIIEHENWWKEEMPSEEEYLEAEKNLSKNGNQVDYILSHAAPIDTVCCLIRRKYIPHIAENELPLNIFLENIRKHVRYTHWFFGHYHIDCKLWRNQRAVLSDIVCTAQYDSIAEVGGAVAK